MDLDLISEGNPALTWDCGTAYDFLISLHVLNNPNKFALRGSWAKGVRSRLPADAQELFSKTSDFYLFALPWIHSLPRPKDGLTALKTLASIPPNERMATLFEPSDYPQKVKEIFRKVAAKGAWEIEDRDEIWTSMEHWRSEGTNEDVNKLLDLWAKAQEFGERSLEAFETYYDVFFAEEEARILPALETTTIRAEELAERLELVDLLEELSEGVRFDKPPGVSKLVMVPSFWVSPLITLKTLSATKAIFVFGGRPADESLVPGELIPDILHRTLKALADPTRLRILNYLSEEPHTPTKLAKRLRLRAPTVVYHLNNLRLAGLVYVTFGKGDKRYAARLNRIAEMYRQLQIFLEGDHEIPSVPREIDALGSSRQRVA
jgi:DNA-binding transcriptional ArsR family regulator